MINYPPGMTREDWKHIDGDQHYRNCPMHEDNDDLNTDLAQMLRLTIDHLASISGYESRIISAADCAAAARRVAEARAWLKVWEKKYGFSGCCCDEIAEAEKEEALLRRVD